GSVELVLILTKSVDTRAAAQAALPMLTSTTAVVTLQNGLGNVEIISEVLGAERVLQGMTYVGAAVDGPGSVRLTSMGQSFVGESDGGRSERAQTLADTLSAAGMPTTATDELPSMIWGKLIINAALNATCALTGANGTTALGSAAAYAWLGMV